MRSSRCSRSCFRIWRRRVSSSAEPRRIRDSDDYDRMPLGSRHLLHMQLTYQKFDLPLKHVFTISRGSVTVQETLVVQLAADGKYGYGEATTNSFYGATIPNMSSAIESVRSIVEAGIAR